jgi:hypothetical protein
MNQLTSPFQNKVFARLSSRQNLKLWRVNDAVYSNIDHGFCGDIRFEFMDTGWLDMIWILASIASGNADPSLVTEILRTQPNHLATKGFHELGKLYRTDYMVRYGMDINLRRFVIRHTAGGKPGTSLVEIFITAVVVWYGKKQGWPERIVLVLNVNAKCHCFVECDGTGAGHIKSEK